MHFDTDRLFRIDIADQEVTEVDLGENLLLPTTVAEYNREALVVNSQHNDQESPNLPFTVARIPVPDGVLD